MKRLSMPGFFVSIFLTVLFVHVSGAEGPGSKALNQPSQDRRTRPTQKKSTAQKSNSVSAELRKINGRLAGLKSENDSLKARVNTLEMNIRIVTAALPELQGAIRSTIQAKALMDSSELAMVNQLSMALNKIILLEDKAAYIDSTNFEILSQLVLLENRIVSLTSSFSDIMAASSGEDDAGPTALDDNVYRSQYVAALTAYQNGQYTESGRKFRALLATGTQHTLADNAQYWLAECHYALRDFKAAIASFEEVFTYSGTDKGDDVRYKIALSFWNSGNETRARREFRKLLADYPETDLGDKARRYLQ
jgi:TolA-binding protein